MEYGPLIDLQTLANLAEIFGVLTVIAGVLFGAYQVREFRIQRRYSITVELMRSFYNPDLARAVHLIRQLPEGISAVEMRSRGPEFEQAAILICTTYETFGLLVFRDVAPFSMVRELTGGLLLTVFNKLRQWMRDVRVEQSQPSWAEWFEWLADRMQDYNESHALKPAYERHADWVPHS